MAINLGTDPFVLIGDVMHQRLSPERNGFRYPIYYVGLPLNKLSEVDERNLIAIDRFAPTSFYRKDHGCLMKGGDLMQWGLEQCRHFNLHQPISSISLIAMPRIFGFVFNPVSFWLCFDRDNQLRAILYEVNNTFGETHTYICAHDDGAAIGAADWISTKKEFYVSPFLKREGHYEFRIQVSAEKLQIFINYFDRTHNHVLATSLCGALQPLNRKALSNAFWQAPMITQKALSLIYWQALKLKAKGLPYLTLPRQKVQRVSLSSKK